MDRRLLAAGLIALGAVLALSGCVPIPTGTGVEVSRLTEPSEDEELLQQQAAAFQRTVTQSIAAGAVFAGASAERGVPGVAFVVLPSSVVGGTYLAFVQQRFSTQEARLEKVQRDLQVANETAEAAIRNMRAVLAEQRADLAAARAQSQEALAVEQANARANALNAQRIATGAQEWRAEFIEAQQNLPETQSTAVDQQIAALGQRIEAMREVAEALAREI